MTAPALTAFWITTPSAHGPIGFGVTARTLADGLGIIRGWGFELPEDLSSLAMREGRTVADLDRRHVVVNMGPIVTRGLWYPFVGVGVPRWMDVS